MAWSDTFLQVLKDTMSAWSPSAGQRADPADQPALPSNGKKLSQMRSSRTSASSSGSTESRSPSRCNSPSRSSFASASSHSKSTSAPKVCLQPGLDAPVERVFGRRAARREQEVIGQERLLAFLLLGLADDVVEDAGVVVDVAVVDVVGQDLLVQQRLALESHPLRHDEAAERDQAAERGERAGHVVVLHRARTARDRSWRPGTAPSASRRA